MIQRATESRKRERFAIPVQSNREENGDKDRSLADESKRSSLNRFEEDEGRESMAEAQYVL